MAIPEIVTDRLILRRLRLGDAVDMYAYAQDEAVARPGLWEPYDSLEACSIDVARLVENDSLMWWALEYRNDARVIGRVQLSDWSRRHSHAELSYALRREYWGQGLMTEAVVKAVEYGWEELRLHRLSAVVRPDNLASVRILENLGMKHEGRMRHHRWLWGEWVDLDLYAVVRG
jgi:ribosomal-protein-alanine N-acetyltransferase